MIPAKIDSISITTIREKGMESILDWFDQHKQSFYTLGWSYLRSQQQMEELFYRSISKVHKELPRFKSETSFDTWVTSIFIHTCQELSDHRSLQDSEEDEQPKDLFKVLDRLKEYEKEAIALTFVKGFSQEESAQLLQVSVERMKELLFSGIQSLRKETGYGLTFNGCKEYHEDYMDYLERTLERSKKIDFEIHIYRCPDCQEDLATFQDVMLNLTESINDLHVPTGFMEKVKDRLVNQEKSRQQKNKKRIRVGLIFTGVFTILIGLGFFTGMFTNLYYSWTEEDQELRAFLGHDLGERLNLEAESDGVKIKIKSAVADDIQTLVFYEIEDTHEENQFMMNYDDGVMVENAYEIMSRDTYPRYYLPDLKTAVNKKEKNVYHGKISLPPLTKKSGTIKLKITKLQKLFRDSTGINGVRIFGNTESKIGKWNFKIPVTKKPSVKYALHKKTEIEGIPIRIDKLTIAPTATILQVGINNEQSKKRIDALYLDSLDVNNKKVKADMYGSSFGGSPQDMNWNTLQMRFDPLFGEKPKEVKIQFKSISLMIEDQKTIELDASQEYPQTFEYAGSTISIDKVKIGQPAEVVISNHEMKNREYESLQFQVMGEGENVPSSMDMSSEGVFVDNNGVEYPDPSLYQDIEQPRYFTKVQSMVLRSDDPKEKVIPKRLEIHGYSTTKYLDDVVKISLE